MDKIRDWEIIRYSNNEVLDTHYIMQFTKDQVLFYIHKTLLSATNIQSVNKVIFGYLDNGDLVDREEISVLGTG